MSPLQQYWLVMRVRNVHGKMVQEVTCPRCHGGEFPEFDELGEGESYELLSEDELQVNQGSLYASLHRLTRQAWIRSEWRTTENNRRARYYELTSAGRARLGLERDHWKRLAGAVDRIMEAGGAPETPAPSGG